MKQSSLFLRLAFFVLCLASASGDAWERRLPGILEWMLMWPPPRGT
jgi:hypothetical protein